MVWKVRRAAGRCPLPSPAPRSGHQPPPARSRRSRLQSRLALAEVMAAAERSLPQAKRNALLRQYRASGVQLRRRERRQQAGGGASGWPEEQEDEDTPPATFSHLPAEVIAQVFR